MKKNKRYVRICAALLCAVLCLSVNVAPAMAAKVTQADIDALKGNAASLDKKQKEIQSKRSPLLTKLKDKMSRNMRYVRAASALPFPWVACDQSITYGVPDSSMITLLGLKSP